MAREFASAAASALQCQNRRIGFRHKPYYFICPTYASVDFISTFRKTDMRGQNLAALLCRRLNFGHNRADTKCFYSKPCDAVLIRQVLRYMAAVQRGLSCRLFQLRIGKSYRRQGRRRTVHDRFQRELRNECENVPVFFLPVRCRKLQILKQNHLGIRNPDNTQCAGKVIGHINGLSVFNTKMTASGSGKRYFRRRRK